MTVGWSSVVPVVEVCTYAAILLRTVSVHPHGCTICTAVTFTAPADIYSRHIYHTSKDISYIPRPVQAYAEPVAAMSPPRRNPACIIIRSVYFISAMCLVAVCSTFSCLALHWLLSYLVLTCAGSSVRDSCPTTCQVPGTTTVDREQCANRLSGLLYG